MQQEMLNGLKTAWCRIRSGKRIWRNKSSGWALPLASKYLCKHHYVAFLPFNLPIPGRHPLLPLPSPQLSILLAFSSPNLPPPSLMLICIRLDLFTNVGAGKGPCPRWFWLCWSWISEPHLPPDSLGCCEGRYSEGSLRCLDEWPHRSHNSAF